MIAAVAIVGTGAGALNLAEELASAEGVGAVTVYGRQEGVPAHTVFARGLARYVFGLEPFHRETVAVLLAVPDERVPELAFSVAGQGAAPAGCVAFHLSGVLPTDALAPLHSQGYALGAFHPLGASSRASEGATRVTGGYVAVTGSPAAVSVARRLTDALDADVLTVPAGRRPLVQAATAMVGGYLEPLIALSTRLMERAGIAADDAAPALISVARSALSRLEEGGTSVSPANPVVDGDVETLALHLRALDPEDQRLYALFATEILRLDAETVDADTREAMHDLLSRYVGLETTSIG